MTDAGQIQDMNHPSHHFFLLFSLLPIVFFVLQGMTPFKEGKSAIINQ
jgi:hypothetical protein